MLLYVIMAVAFIGMVVGLQKEKGGATWGRPVAILCVLIAVGAAVYQMVGGPSDKTGDLERAYREVKGKKLGTYLEGKFAGKKALILLPPEAPAMGEDSEMGEMPHLAVLEGLKEAMKGIDIVGTIDPKMPADVKAKMEKGMSGSGGEGGDMMMPEAQMWFGVKALNKELEAYKGKYDLLICLTGLPGVETMGMGGPVTHFKNLTFWAEKDIKVALAEGGIAKFEGLIKGNRICAAVAYKQKIDEKTYDVYPDKDLDKAFEARFVLITPENVGQHSAYFPKGR